jgi:sulfur carrier protein
MNIIVNGQPRTFDPGSVYDLLCSYGLEQKMVVVEIDGSIIPKEAWESTALRDGLNIELVHFVGGG